MAKLMIKEILQFPLGQPVQTEFVVQSLKSGISKRNAPFANCILHDKSGAIPAVMWDYVPHPNFETGKVCLITGEIGEYQGKPQIKIARISPRLSTSDEELSSVTKYSVEEMWDKVCGYIHDMENIHIATVASELMFHPDYSEGFKVSPAATYMHHAFVGGLLEHTSQMAEMADKMFELPFIRDVLNKDLCMFGVLFHDFCKAWEYGREAGFKKTTQGILVPHIPMMASLIFESCNLNDVPEVIRDHLMHVVLAHHGQQAYGSPVDMAIPEAAFVHYIDNLHGDVFGILQKIAANSQVDHFKVFSKTIITKRFSDVLNECAAATAQSNTE